jgi:spore maturation protein CgeB
MMCSREKPTHLLAAGLMPIRPEDLRKIGAAGIQRLTFLTDDPWNAAHRSRWFHRSLNQYDYVFSPRKANLQDLRNHGCRRVHYLPFAYSPDVHLSTTSEQIGVNGKDILFAGGADGDRVPYIRALVLAGFSVALYGGYWGLHQDLRTHWHGHANLDTLRRMTLASKISLCLGRRANRDGHAMRTFEAAAMAGCMLIEETHEHREIFGPDGQAVTYFRTIPEMVARARWLLAHDAERVRLRAAANSLITNGHNTYGDRLVNMLKTAGLETHFSDQTITRNA